MRGNPQLFLSAALIVSAVTVSGEGDGGRRLTLEAEVRDRLASSKQQSGAPGLTGGSLFILNDANISVVSAFPMSTAATSFAPFSGSLGWGLNLDPGGTRGILGVSSDSSGFVAVYSGSGRGGADLSGNFGLRTFSGDLAEAFPGAAAEPGSVMAIDPARPGALTVAREPYDRRVLGVASGARDYRPGITLRGLADVQGVTLTLSGTVYCLATDANGPIRTGDLLTTSSIPGHAMRATDLDRARGAILGKAMEDLKEGHGLMLIFATLQ